MLQDRFVPPAGAFTRSVTVRFSHCDPAGIVYFPHYFDLFNGLIEDWYKEELGYDYAELVMGSRFGFPFVHLDCDFKIPSRMGEEIHLTVMVDRIGRSSLTFAVAGRVGERLIYEGELTCVFVTRSTGRSIPIPEVYRAKLA